MTGVLLAFGGYAEHATSGAERMAWRTAERLAARGHTVVALTDADRPADLNGAAWPVYRSEAELARAMPGWRPDIVHACNLALPGYIATAIGLARRFGIRLALTPASARETWPDERAAAAACALADVIYVLTPAESGPILAAGARPGRLRRIPQAPDLTGRPDPAGFRRRYGLDGPVVLFVGRKIAAKGYRVLLDAAPLVWRSAPRTTFVFAGPNGEPEAAAAFASRPDTRLLDVGMVDDQTKHDALSACDVLCLPSSADVFPLVFAEAWACGKPVVSGDFAGVRDAVADGVDGVVVPPRPDPVAGTLIRLLADDAARAALGSAGLRRVRQEMTWDKVADSVEDGYRYALSGSRAAAEGED